MMLDKSGRGDMGNEQEDYNEVYKIILIGNSGAGKSNLIHTFIKSKKPETTTMPTVGVDYYSKNMVVSGGKRIKAQIWDTAGSQQYRSITMGHYRKAVGALIVFQITNKKSFDDAQFWLEAIRQRSQNFVVVGLIGNKIDKIDKREVTRQEAQRYASQKGLFYMETTYNDYNSIVRVFEKLVEEISKSNDKHKDIIQNSPNVSLNPPSIDEQEPCKC